MAREVIPLIALPEVESFGEAMQALTPARRAFAYAKVFHGVTNTEAARLAGYSATSKNVLEVQAHSLAHHPSVQAAILELSRQLMRTLGPRAIHAIAKIMDSPDAAERDRLKAASMLLDRGGFHAVSESHQHQHVHMTEAEKDRRILALAAEIGLSDDEAKKMLIAPADYEKNAEGVFEMTPDPPTPTFHPAHVRRRRRVPTPPPVGSSEGLEDLL